MNTNYALVTPNMATLTNNVTVELFTFDDALLGSRIPRWLVVFVHGSGQQERHADEMERQVHSQPL